MTNDEIQNLRRGDLLYRVERIDMPDREMLCVVEFYFYAEKVTEHQLRTYTFSVPLSRSLGKMKGSRVNTSVVDLGRNFERTPVKAVASFIERSRRGMREQTVQLKRAKMVAAVSEKWAKKWKGEIR